jgi:gliding motility-associated-like protein
MFLPGMIQAQLTADFKPDKTGGCSPLAVSFQNTTTGASPAATYQWSFGNGNTSILVNPGTTYTDEKTYTVTLTVKDGAVTSTKSIDVIIYKKPVVDFTTPAAKGCAPLNVSFTSTSAAGDGTITNYFWDFGDGHTLQGANQQQVSNNFLLAQKPSIQLTVTNSFGCQSTVAKNNILEITSGVNTSFNVSKSMLCEVADTLYLTNTSSGVEPLTYLWEFGDGDTSSLKDPFHKYSTKGLYNIKLTATSADGCQNSFQLSGINVANYTANVTLPSTVCLNMPGNYISSTTPQASNVEWIFSDDNNPVNGNNVTHTFTTAGNYSLKVTATFGTCKVVLPRTIHVNAAPAISSFIADKLSLCAAPVDIQLKDTSAAAVKWVWIVNGTFASSQQSVLTSLTYNGEHTIDLLITDAKGCMNSTSKKVMVVAPDVQIVNTSSIAGCVGFTAGFKTESTNANVVSWSWSSGDGATSTSATPSFTYNTAGTYVVSVNYITDLGCKGSDTMSVNVFQKPTANFIAPTQVCGNSGVLFTNTSTNTDSLGAIWNFGDNNTNTEYTPVHYYPHTGVFTVQLIVFNGICRDTITRSNYITVVPPFPNFSHALTTCAGQRGDISIVDFSNQVQSWKWDFGDGTAPISYNSYVPILNHTYTKSGRYVVRLTAVNNFCTVTRTDTVHILLKQNPVLSSLQQTICYGDELNIHVDSLDANIHYGFDTTYNYYVNPLIWQNENGTPFTATMNGKDPFFLTSYNAGLQPLPKGINKIRLITTSNFFGCKDTTNYITVEVQGPTAGYKILNNDNCYVVPVIFQDTSQPYNNQIPIVKWEWDLADGVKDTLTTNAQVQHVYNNPGDYATSLKVTDANGCISTSTAIHVSSIGPKADFVYDPALVPVNADINFINQTNTYGSSPTNYQWHFTYDNSTITTTNAIKNYKNLSADTVRLIAIGPKCSDTTIKVIPIRNVKSAFSYTSQYINQNSCPPLAVYFKSEATNATSLLWDFGDGSFSKDNPEPSHTYTTPGKYTVTLIVTGLVNASDTSSAVIIVKGPYAVLKNDIDVGCSPTKITLTASSSNVTAYTWDFADGTVVNSTDSFSAHIYDKAGLYAPALILKDSSGCAITYPLGKKILIDSIRSHFNNSLLHVCDSGLVVFTEDVYSFAKNNLQKPWKFKWMYNSLGITDTTDIEKSSYYFNKNGHFPVTLTVQSEAGCISSFSDTIRVSSISQASIKAVDSVCKDAPVLFSATASLLGDLKWNWDFKNAQTAGTQSVSPQFYSTPGKYNVQLILENDGCFDTAFHALTVNKLPVIGLASQQTKICLGDSVHLHANDGIIFSWKPVATLSNSTVASPFAKPKQTTVYTVDVTNQHGCTATDSVRLTVSLPFKVVTTPDTTICIGNSLQLNTSGAISYKWINVNDLSSTNIPDPVASPKVTQIYAVVGFGNDACFTDTARIKITVKPQPSIEAEQQLVMVGSVFNPKIKYSTDIEKWQWTPSTFLSCTNCAYPVISPRSDITYTVKGTDKFGCIAQDTFSIKLFCSQSVLFVPNSFTPNGDGMNDVFFLRGKGIQSVKYFAIFNRLGEKVFEKANINIEDPSQGWNGSYLGKQLSSDVFTYIAEVVCDTGEHFKTNGTIMIIR